LNARLVLFLFLCFLDDVANALQVGNRVLQYELIPTRQSDRLTEWPHQLLDLWSDGFRIERANRHHDGNDFRVASLIQFLDAYTRHQDRINLYIGGHNREDTLAANEEVILRNQAFVDDVDDFRQGIGFPLGTGEGKGAGW